MNAVIDKLDEKSTERTFFHAWSIRSEIDCRIVAEFPLLDCFAKLRYETAPQDHAESQDKHTNVDGEEHINDASDFDIRRQDDRLLITKQEQLKASLKNVSHRLGMPTVADITKSRALAARRGKHLKLNISNGHELISWEMSVYFGNVRIGPNWTLQKSMA